MSAHPMLLPSGDDGETISNTTGVGAVETIVSLAAAGEMQTALTLWRTLIEVSPLLGVECWFRTMRAIASHSDVTRMLPWIAETSPVVLAAAPDRLRVERYIELFEKNWVAQIEAWTGGDHPAGRIALSGVQEWMPPRRSVPLPAAGMLMATVAAASETLVLTIPMPAPRANLPSELDRFRVEEMRRLGWLDLMIPAIMDAELHVLRDGRFVSYAHDHRGGIVFDGCHVVPDLIDEHAMLHMTGRVPLVETTAREPVAFAVVSRCPLDPYHELMGSFASLAFYALLPANTPVIVPKRYEALRPLYEGAGIDWSLVRDYEDVAGTIFDRVVTPGRPASRALFRGFFQAAARTLANPEAAGTLRQPLYLVDRTAELPANADEVAGMAERHGFSSLVVQETDIVTLCRRIAEADIILAFHGSGLSYAALAQQDTLMIEMIPPHAAEPQFLQIAADGDLDYVPLAGVSLAGVEDAAAWRIEPDRLDRLLQLAASRDTADASASVEDTMEPVPRCAARLIRLIERKQVAEAALTFAELIVLDPPEAVVQWFAATRRLGRSLDIRALRTWMDLTKPHVLQHAPDKLRVERYGYLYRDTVAWQFDEWRQRLIEGERLDLRRIEPIVLPRFKAQICDPGRLLDHLRSDESHVLVLPPPIIADSEGAGVRLSAFRRRQRQQLGWNEANEQAALPDIELFVLRDVRFVHFEADDRGGMLVDGDHMVPELCNEHYMLDMLGHCRDTPRSRRMALAFAPVSSCPRNHYHELMDTFASLAFMELLPPNTPIVVPHRYDVLRPLYEAAGFDWSRILDYSDVADIVFDRVVAPREGSSRGVMRDFINRSFNSETTGAPQDGLLYLSRSRVPERVLDNEPAVEALARRHGFTILHTQEMSASEQARRLAGASVVLAPHGAALSNIVFAPGGAVVIEIMPLDYRVPAISVLCAENGLIHLPIVGSAFADTHSQAKHWTVNIALVEAAILLGLHQVGQGTEPASQSMIGRSSRGA